MDYTLNDEQTALVAAVQSILDDHRELPPAARQAPCYFNATLQQLLDDLGFLDCAREYTPLEAALVTMEVASVPAVAEVAISSIVVPRVCGDRRIPGPVSIVDGDRMDRAHRNLTVAINVLIDCGAGVALVPVVAGMVEPVESIYGYPYGKFAEVPELRSADTLDAGALRQWWRVAIAAEIAGATRGAVEFTVAYVKQRHVFGKAIGSFQAIQHRLAQCHQIAQGMRYLTLKAAWSGNPADASMAACYCQQHVQKIQFDLHQFNGAMGVTFEHLLHFWTYRLRALQAEAGGVYESALDVADRRWGAAA